MYTKTLQIGQKVHCILYGGMDGYITEINGEQSPGTCKEFGGIGVTGGKANLYIAFPNHFSDIPESLARCSVQWHIFDTVISAEELAVVTANTQANLNAKAKAQAKAAQEKRDEETRQLTAPEYAHMKSRRYFRHDAAETAKNIRAHLKNQFPGIKFSVRKEGYDHIDISWNDGPSSKAVESALDNFKEVSGYDMGDNEILKHHAWIFGTVRYLFTNRHISDEALQEAIDKVNAHYNNDATLEQYKNGTLPILCQGANFDSYNRELSKVLNGDIDY